MSAKGFLGVEKLRGHGIIKKAAVHNKREKPDTIETIDGSRTHLNYCLDGPDTAQEVEQLAKRLMAEAGITVERKNGVLGIEIVFSLPRGFKCNERQFFTDCVAWAKGYFGCPVLSADVHMDQSQRHCHVIILPLIDGGMRGRQVVGMRADMFEMQKQFHDQVASRHGLKKPVKLHGAAKEGAVNQVLAHYRQTSDSVLHSASWETIRRSIQDSPEDYLADLGLEIAREPVKPFVEFVVSKGKGPRRETERRVILQTAITDSEAPKQGGETAITVLAATAGGHETDIAVQESGAKKHNRYPVLTVSIPAPLPQPIIPPFRIDSGGVIHEATEAPQQAKPVKPSGKTEQGRYLRLTAKPHRLFTGLLDDWHPTTFDDAPLQSSEDSAMEQPPQATAFTSRLKGMKGLTSTTGDSDSTEDEAGEPIDEPWCSVAQDEEVSAWAD